MEIYLQIKRYSRTEDWIALVFADPSLLDWLVGWPVDWEGDGTVERVRSWAGLA